MKKLISVVLILVLAISLTFYFFTRRDTELSKSSNGNISNISSFGQYKSEMSVEYLGESTYQINIYNTGSNDISTSEYYTIEVKRDNEWYVIPIDLAFLDYAKIINPNEKFMQKINLGSIDFSFNDGTYRIIKKINLNDKYEILGAEFKVEKES